MKKEHPAPEGNGNTQKGYNEKNPSQPEGAFPPASAHQKPKAAVTKSNAADKKRKEDGQ